MQNEIQKICEEVAFAICDDYCKWPEKYKSNYKDSDEAYEHMMADKCENCPLNRIN